MAYGEDVKPKSREQILKEKRAKHRIDEPEVDRFDESKSEFNKSLNNYFLLNFINFSYVLVQNEIEERKQFLETMEKVGKGKEYSPIISAQISGLVREMEIIDRKRSEELANALAEAEDSTR